METDKMETICEKMIQHRVGTFTEHFTSHLWVFFSIYLVRQLFTFCLFEGGGGMNTTGPT